jgi:MarR family
MANWTFLTNHALVLLCIADDPEARLRDIAASLKMTERSAFGIVTDLVEAGYVVKEKDGRRNRYHIQAHLPLPDAAGRERTVGEILALLVGTGPGGKGPNGDGPNGDGPNGAGPKGDSPKGDSPNGDSPNGARLGSTGPGGAGPAGGAG